MGKTYFILSPEQWGINFVSKHHYASLLAERGNTVYFFNPPGNQRSIHKALDNLYVVDYKMPKGVNSLPIFLKNWLHRWTWKSIKSALSLPTPDVVWSFDPFVFQNLKVFNKNAICMYHPVDVHATDHEFECADTANVIFSISNSILDKFNGCNTPKHFVNHGLALHFTKPVEDRYPAFDTIDTSKINVGYVGNLRYKHIDYPILFQIIERNPNVIFHFVGPYELSNLTMSHAVFDAEIQQLKTYANVLLYGPVKSQMIPGFMEKMSLFLMCYVGDKKSIELSNSHKILEYLSTGKPTITHLIKEYEHKKLVFMAHKNTDIPDLFTEVINNLSVHSSNEAVAFRKEFALNNTYPNQLDKILHLSAIQ